VTEFLGKWVAAAFLLSFAWAERRRSRRRAGWTFALTLALLGFEVGLVESVLEAAAAAVLGWEASRNGGEGRSLALSAGALAAAGVLAWFAVRPLPALLSGGG
jgi:hypothetical protein